MTLQSIPDTLLIPIENWAPRINTANLLAVPPIASMGLKLVIPSLIRAFLATLACDEKDILAIEPILIIQCSAADVDL